MSNATHEQGHESSTAAWVAVVIMLVGVAIGTLFLFLNVIPLVWIGALVVVVGIIVGAILSKAGFGMDSSRGIRH
jgi:hypothetical protein